MNHRPPYLAIVATALCCAWQSAGAAPSSPYEELVEAVTGEMRDAHVSGVSVAVVNDRGIIWSRGFGVVAAGSDIPATADTVYRTGAVSKVVTAAAVMRLVERGRLELDSPVKTVLPAFKPHNRFSGAKPMTVRSLLAHHSGLPGDSLRGLWCDARFSVAEMMPVLSQVWLANPPQTRYRQSNLDYAVLGCMIEAESGRPFAEAMRNEILTPTGMMSSSFASLTSQQRRVALPHRSGQPVPQTGFRDAPAGSLSTTANDLGRFLRMLLARGQADGNTILRADTVESMFHRQYTDADWPFARAMGLGWTLGDRPVPGVGEAAWQSGRYPGYSSYIILLPDERLGAVVLANDEAAGSLAAKLATTALELTLHSKRGRHPAAAGRPLPKPVEVAHLETANLGDYAGRYLVFGQLLPVKRDSGKLTFNFQGSDMELVPGAHGRLQPRAKVAFGLFSVPVEGYAVRMTAVGKRHFAVLEGTPQPLPFEKIEPGPISEAWRRRLGTWRVINPDDWLQIKSVRLEVDGGVLVLRATTASPMWGMKETTWSRVLRPLDDRRAVVRGGGMDEDGAIADTGHGKPETLRYSGYVLERVGKTGR